VRRGVVRVEVDMGGHWRTTHACVHEPVNMGLGWERWREDGRCELQAHEEGVNRSQLECKLILLLCVFLHWAGL
jgi:hypothetical protein